ncbi:hypothetical protein [Aestuariivirga sp.]|uniref:hypothetical protein n=1 Tax=Aestuariivirga sp. TaxID=2650926 RepID=UPI00359429C0
MFFEIAGFLSGVAGIAVAFGLLLRHQRERVISGFYRDRRKARGGNALIWPSR